MSDFDYNNTIISQYGTSPRLTALISLMAEWFGLGAFDLLYDNVWNIATAREYGLDVLGRILVLPRPIVSGSPVTDAMYRNLLYCKAFKNITDCSLQSINVLLNFLYSTTGKAYVIDNNDMTMTIHFGSGAPGWAQPAVDFGAFPVPSGVLINFQVPLPIGDESGDEFVTEGGTVITTEG